MQKGILLEVEGRTGIVLTPAGEFRRVPLPAGDPVVGDEIPVSETEAGLSPGIRRRAWGWVAAAAAVLLAVLSPVGYWQWSLGQPAALVMIDINPSLQLTVNGRRQVMDAEGLNADGQAVLEQVEWQRRPVEQVTRAIAAQAIQLGKLNPAADDSAVVVAVAPLAGKSVPVRLTQAIVEQSRTALQTAVVQGAESQGAAPLAGVAVMEATPDEVEEARRQDLTVPRLILLEELQAEHPEVTADAIRQVPPGQFLKSLGIHPGEVLSRAEQRRTQTGKALPAAADPGGDGKDDGGRKGPGNANSPGKGNPGNGSPGRGGDDRGQDGRSQPNRGNPGKGSPGGSSPGKGNAEGNSSGRGSAGASGSGKDNTGLSLWNALWNSLWRGAGDDDDVRRKDDRSQPGPATPGNPGRSTPGKGDSGASNPGKNTPGANTPGKNPPGVSTPGKGNAGRGADQDDRRKDDRRQPGPATPGNPGKNTPGKGDSGASTPGKNPPGAGTPGKGNPGRGADEDDRRKDDRSQPGPGNTANPGKNTPGKGDSGASTPGRNTPAAADPRKGNSDRSDPGKGNAPGAPGRSTQGDQERSRPGDRDHPWQGSQSSPNWVFGWWW